jgi:hypothetical protein
MVSLRDLLLARTQSLDHERRRERLLRVRLPFARSPLVMQGADSSRES